MRKENDKERAANQEQEMVQNCAGKRPDCLVFVESVDGFCLDKDIGHLLIERCAYLGRIIIFQTESRAQ
mgnify:CR=1 FL=1